MPELNKTYQLKITVEQFLKACSENELKEIDLLLGGYLNPTGQLVYLDEKMDFAFELKTLISPFDVSRYIQEINNIPTHLKSVFIDLIKWGYNVDGALEAIKVVNEMTINTTVCSDEILELMKYFSRLEKIRLQSLVKKPQLGNSKSL